MSDQGTISFIEVSTKWLGFHLHFLVSVHRTLQSLLSVFFLLISMALSIEDHIEKYFLLKV